MSHERCKGFWQVSGYAVAGILGIAEQGLFDLLKMVMLFGIVVKAFRRARPPIGRVLVVSLAAWSFTYMTHAATRLSPIGVGSG